MLIKIDVYVKCTLIHTFQDLPLPDTFCNTILDFMV